MKKLFALTFCLLFAAGAIFAADDYHGDIQIHFGIGFDSMQNKGEKAYATLFEADVDSWNKFEINETFSVGFLLGFNGGLGECYEMTNSDGDAYSSDVPFAAHFNFLIGPAVGINLKNIVSFNLGAGLTYEFAINNWGLAGLGFGADLQAKFIPTRKLSPVAGYRFQVIRGMFGDTRRTTYFANKIYVGFSFNW